VRCEAREDIEVVSGADTDDVSVEGGEVRISGISGRLEVRVPAGIDLFIGSLSGSVDVRGRARSVNVSTASGSIEVEEAQKAELRTISGHVSLNRCEGDCRISTKSGRAEAGAIGQADIATMSGRVEVRKAAGPVRVKSASGRVEVGADGAYDVDVKTMSGSVTVRMPKHVRPSTRFRTLSGRQENHLGPGQDCQVSVATMSGRIELGPL
jgi:DUF4097 and DUF4098 domain-containing protein YvlB